jgi:hypothetical protein
LDATCTGAKADVRNRLLRQVGMLFMTAERAARARELVCKARHGRRVASAQQKVGWVRMLLTQPGRCTRCRA